MTTIQTTVLELRSNLGNYLSQLQTKDQNLIAVTKRGKKVAALINPEDAEKFIEWKNSQELKELYYSSKLKFEKYGQDFLAKKGLKKADLTADQLVDIVANA